MSGSPGTVRLKVSPQVARTVSEKSDRDLRLRAARGEARLEAKDRVVALLFLSNAADKEIRSVARSTLKKLSLEILEPLIGDSRTPPKILDLFCRLRIDDPVFLKRLLLHPALPHDARLHIASHADGSVLEFLERENVLSLQSEEMRKAVGENPRAGRTLERRIEKGTSSPESSHPETGEAGSEPENTAPEEHLSKYQMSLDMKVSDKIKFAMTGDKEWRSLLIKDANLLVSSAVLKNPRITEAEVLAVAKNRTSSDELIRLITLNRDWIKSYEIKKALVVHPRTPLPKALRYMNVLTERDIKMIAKSKNVSSVIVNNARRIMMAKDKKG